MTTPASRQHIERRLQQLGPRTREQHIAAGHRHRHRIGAGLDPVGQHGVPRADEPLTPSMTIRGVPAPEMCAPILLRQSATSAISGSQAALVMTVVPLRERCRHQRNMGAADGHFGKIDLGRPSVLRAPCAIT